MPTKSKSSSTSSLTFSPPPLLEHYRKLHWLKRSTTLLSRTQRFTAFLKMGIISSTIIPSSDSSDLSQLDEKTTSSLALITVPPPPPSSTHSSEPQKSITSSLGTGFRILSKLFINAASLPLTYYLSAISQHCSWQDGYA